MSAKTKNCRYFNGTICTVVRFKPKHCAGCMAFRPKDEPHAGKYTEEVEISEEVWNNL